MTPERQYKSPMARITLSLSSEDAVLLREQAKARKCSASQLVRDILRQEWDMLEQTHESSPLA